MDGFVIKCYLLCTSSVGAKHIIGGKTMETLMCIVICSMLLTIPNYAVDATVESTENYGVEDNYETIQPRYDLPERDPPEE